ncbi:hypothetical protein HDV05_000478 [Chytridiales sp. JEL 0842]|nr:hypothetical protein HDV05_000478 [Chytridiales sp. JEL 0842]
MYFTRHLTLTLILAVLGSSQLATAAPAPLIPFEQSLQMLPGAPAAPALAGRAVHAYALAPPEKGTTLSKRSPQVRSTANRVDTAAAARDETRAVRQQVNDAAANSPLARTQAGRQQIQRQQQQAAAEAAAERIIRQQQTQANNNPITGPPRLDPIQQANAERVLAKQINQQLEIQNLPPQERVRATVDAQQQATTQRVEAQEAARAQRAAINAAAAAAAANNDAKAADATNGGVEDLDGNVDRAHPAEAEEANLDKRQIKNGRLAMFSSSSEDETTTDSSETTPSNLNIGDVVRGAIEKVGAAVDAGGDAGAVLAAVEGIKAEIEQVANQRR